METIGIAADTYFNTSRRLLPGTGFRFFEGLAGGELRGTGSFSMARKTKAPTLEQIQEALLAHSFAVKPAVGAAGGLWVEKYGCAAILARGTGASAAPGVDPGSDTVVAYRERPGAVVKGEIARLLDRGYQKFLMTGKYELPATAQQLRAIHQFTEELTQVTGGISLYNEALGTTSDLYEYDRVKGREPLEPAAARPWDAAGASHDAHE